MSDRTSTATATADRATESEALLVAADLAKLDLPRVYTWRVSGSDHRLVEIDGQLRNDAVGDLADWADFLDGSRVQSTSVEGVPFGTLSVVGLHGGMVIRIWTAITRPVPDPDAAYKATIEADLVGGVA